MPKQKRKLTQAEQSRRFNQAVEDAINAGVLDPDEAQRKLDALIDGMVRDAKSDRGKK